MKTHIPYLVVIIGLFIVIAINRCGDQSPTKTTTRVVSDSTVVDSLSRHIEYLESLPPDTFEVQVEIPQKPDTVYVDSTGLTINEYNTSHIDSLISAFWTTKLTGRLISQDFRYTIKNRHVVKEIITRHSTRTITVERTIKKQAGGFLAVGGEVGASPDQLSLSPIVRYQASDGYSYHYRYDVLTESHNVGITIPIRIKIPFL